MRHSQDDTQRPVHVSLAAFPGTPFADAMALARAGVSEPLLGPLSSDHVQLCPQQRGVLDEALVDHLRDRYPTSRFRLHANVRVETQRQIRDWSSFDAGHSYWHTLARLSRRLDAPAYSAHAGRRAESTLDAVFEAARRASDSFGCPCAVEGHYPTPGMIFHLDTWTEYARLLDARVPYAIDLSHLAIVAHHEGRVERSLVIELLAAPECIEVHLSANSGVSDEHQILEQPPWWWGLLAAVTPSAVIFSEGNQFAQQRKEHPHARH